MIDEKTIDQIANQPDVADEWNNYEPPSDFSVPPPAQEYTFMRSTEEGHFLSGSAEYDGSEFAWFNFRAMIQGGEFDGRLAFGGCNTLLSKYRKGTTAQDFILAAKSSQRPTSTQLLSEVKANKTSTLERVIGPFNAITGWEWRCRDCEETFLKGAKNPKSPKKYTGPKVAVAPRIDGKTNPEQICPACQQKVMATLTMVKFVVPKDPGKTVNRPTAPPAPVGMAPAAG